MIHPESRPGGLDDVIDRIVDGGLSPQELREAVARLEETDDGWRRCALAFIEARALGEVLREMDGARPSNLEVLPFRRRAIVARRLAYAASLAVLAFGLGWLGHGVGPNGDRGLTPPARLGENLPGGTDRTRPVAIAQEPHTGRVRPVPPDQSTSLGAGLTTPPFGEGRPAPPEPPTEGLIAGEVEIPFEDWLRDQPPPISPYEQAILEREGYRVEQHREVVLGTLDDGRLAAVPVDEVQVEYVGHIPL
jgi:hypothetical protein